MSSVDNKTPDGDESILRDLLDDKYERPMLRDNEGVPTLNKGKIRLAVSVVPAEYWTFNCWSCEQGGTRRSRYPTSSPSRGSTSPIGIICSKCSPIHKWRDTSKIVSSGDCHVTVRRPGWKIDSLANASADLGIRVGTESDGKV